MRFEVDSSVQEEAELFFTELVGAEASATRSSTRRPEPRVMPRRVTVTTAPTLPAPRSISADTIVDAAAYMVDPDPRVASQSITPQRVHVTKAWLAAHPPSAEPIRVASREAVADPVPHHDRLVDALVIAGFPLGMWGALIASSEADDSPLPDLAREHIGSPIVRTWLQRAAEIAELAWNDAQLGDVLGRIATAARARTSHGIAVAMCARLAASSHRLVSAFDTPAARTAAATFVARLSPGERAAFGFLVSSSADGRELARNRVAGRDGAVPEPLRRRASRIAERVQALHRHFSAELPNPYTVLARW